jgi:hypothetical protein
LIITWVDSKTVLPIAIWAGLQIGVTEDELYEKNLNYWKQVTQDEIGG